MGNDNILVIVIAGGSASGKTTLMKNLIADCEDEVTVLSTTIITSAMTS